MFRKNPCRGFFNSLAWKNILGKEIRRTGTRSEEILPGMINSDFGDRLFQFSMNEALRKKFLSFLNGHPSGRGARRDLIHLMMSTPDYQLT
jgi:hypothetical protein